MTHLRIEQLIRDDCWAQARRQILRALESEPDSHWLLTRLSLTYYEQRRYATALRHVERARRITPTCPLVLWDYAGALQMLGRHPEAIAVYNALIARGVERLAYDDCGEGLARARGLIADSYYRLSQSLDALGRKKQADRAFCMHLDMRGPGCQSIYQLAELGRKPIRSTPRRPPTATSSRRSRPAHSPRSSRPRGG